MPFLKVIKTSYTNKKIYSSKRNGLRHAIFNPDNKPKGYYIGQWKNDIKEGNGKELDSIGWIYEGYWYNDKRHGCGTLSKISKKDHTTHRRYHGEWFAGKKQGFGHNWFEDGTYYEGTYYRNKRQGYGRIWYCNGDYYEGDWENDCYHGMGKLIKDNGNIYEGEFVKGKKNGSGTFYHTSTGQEQRGIWRNDVFTHGIMIDADFRQAAPYPTPYPIPQTKIPMLHEESQNTENVIENNSDTDRITISHFCKKRRTRIIPNFCHSRNTCPCLDSLSKTKYRIL